MNARTIARYGWRPDLPQHTDYAYAPTKPRLMKALPPKVSLVAGCPPVFDQGQLGSCTGNAGAAVYAFVAKKLNLRSEGPFSRLWLYYQARFLENSVSEDAGAEIRDIYKALATVGVPTEKAWPYRIEKFAARPSASVAAKAERHKAVTYSRLDSTNVDLLKACLAEGYPFEFGFTVYTAFESDETARTGVVNLPAKGERALGGHAVMACGYDDGARRFTAQNSWGAEWGDAGRFTIPYSYLTNQNLADDFWTIRVET